MVDVALGLSSQGKEGSVMLDIHTGVPPIDPEKVYSRPSGEDVNYKSVRWLKDGRILFVSDYGREFGALTLWDPEKGLEVLDTPNANPHLSLNPSYDWRY